MHNQEQNPFNPSFGDPPKIMLTALETPEKTVQERIVNSMFDRAIFITGIRGTGKTTYLTECERIINQNPGYQVIPVANNDEIITNIATKLNEITPSHNKIKIPRLKTKYFDFEFTDYVAKLTQPSKLNIIEKLIRELNQSNITPIISIDEISTNKEIISLIQTFNELKRHGSRIFLLMAGLPNLIDDLQTQKNLTFLKRADKIMLHEYTNQNIANKYQHIFNCDRFTANQLAKYVQGYAFAFQLLGYRLWQNNDHHTPLLAIAKEQLPDYQEDLYNESYSEIINELTPVEAKYVEGIIKFNGDFGQIQKFLNKSKGYVSKYRQRLLKEHIIKSTGYGKVEFTLPLFKETVSPYFITE